MAKLSTREIAEKAGYEGLGYAVQSYFSHENIKDEELAKLWKTAADALNQIEEILLKYPEYEQ